jgi:hypothetical protein
MQQKHTQEKIEHCEKIRTVEQILMLPSAGRKHPFSSPIIRVTPAAVCHSLTQGKRMHGRETHTSHACYASVTVFSEQEEEEMGRTGKECMTVSARMHVSCV